MRAVALVLPCICVALGALALDSKEAEAQSYTEVEAAIDGTMPPVIADDFKAIAWRESGFNPAAVNPYSGACSAFQFLPSTAYAMGYTCWDLMDPWVAAQAALELYYVAGFGPWAASYGY